jgi:hypothetical protein
MSVLTRTCGWFLASGYASGGLVNVFVMTYFSNATCPFLISSCTCIKTSIQWLAGEINLILQFYEKLKGREKSTRTKSPTNSNAFSYD